jgi:hypothetical protein
MRLLMRQNFNPIAPTVRQPLQRSQRAENIYQAVYNVMPLLDKRLRSYKLSRKPIPSTAIELKELD